MASTMKTLIDLFYEEQAIAKANGDFSLSETLEQAVSYANNCHWMTSVETVWHVRNCLNSLYGIDPDFHTDESINTALLILDLFEEQYITKRKN